MNSHENTQLGPQSRCSQIETCNGEVEEVHTFCNHLYRPCEPAAEGNRTGNEHHMKEVGNLEAGTRRDRADNHGSEEAHTHAADEFHQSMGCLQVDYGA